MLKRNPTRVLAFVLALFMVLSLATVKSYADEAVTAEDVTVTEENSTEATEAVTETVTEETTEVTTESTEDVKETEEIVFDHMYSDVDASKITTSDLFVSADDASVFTKNTNVVSNYEDVYIISCESVQEAKYVYSYYVDKVNFIVDLADTMTVADEDSEDVADLSDINTGDDAIAILANTDIEEYEGYIALIDSGVDQSVEGFSSKDECVSVIGEDTSDKIGHGTKMYKYIKEENPKAKVLSIKAFDGNKANVADIYAAIMYAIEAKVDVINMSFVGYDIEQNRPVAEAIEKAIEEGITVIGAAGNNGKNAKLFIPGRIDDVITVGAVNNDGTLYKTSNYNADLYVIAKSTSEATAKYAGIYTAKKESNIVFTSLTSDEPETDTSEVTDASDTDATLIFDEEEYNDFEEDKKTADDYNSKYEPAEGKMLSIGIAHTFNTDVKTESDLVHNHPKDMTGYDRISLPLLDYDEDYYSVNISNLVSIDRIKDYYFTLNNSFGVKYKNAELDKKTGTVLISKKVYNNIIADEDIWRDEPDTDELTEADKAVDKDNALFLEMLCVDEELTNIPVTIENKLDNTTETFAIGRGESRLSVYVPYDKLPKDIELPNIKVYLNGSSEYLEPSEYGFNGYENLEISCTPSSVRHILIVIDEADFSLAWNYGAYSRNYTISKAAFTMPSNSVIEGMSVGTSWSVLSSYFGSDFSTNGNLIGYVNAHNGYITTNGPMDFVIRLDVPYNDAANKYASIFEKNAVNNFYPSLTGGNKIKIGSYPTEYPHNPRTGGLNYMPSYYVQSRHAARAVGDHDKFLKADQSTYVYRANIMGACTDHSKTIDTGNFYQATVRVTAKTLDYVELSFNTQGSGQQATGTFRVALTYEQPKGMVEVYKYEEGSKTTPLRNAKFTVYKGGTSVGTISTNSQGYGRLTGLDAGTYTIKETDPPTGYDAKATATNGYTFEIKLTEGKNITYNGIIYNYSFDPYGYRDMHEATIKAKTDKEAFDHFVDYGSRDVEHRLSSYAFDPDYYLRTYSDIANAYTNMSADDKALYNTHKYLYAASHFARWGYKEGRMGRPITYYQSLSEGVNHNQTATVQISVGNTPKIQEAYVTLEKKSTNPDCSKNNPNYSLAGTEYLLFNSSNAAATKDTSNAGYIGKFTVKADGESNVLEIPTEKMNKNSAGVIQPTEFWAIETKVGKGYHIDPDAHKIIITKDNTASNPAVIEVKDKPVDDPIDITIIKKYADNHEEGLQGAEFTVKFYPEDIDSNFTYADLQSKRASSTKVVTSGADGKVTIATDENHYPLGYLTIVETKAPDNFKLDGSTVTVNGKAAPVKMCFVLLPEYDPTTGGYRNGNPVLIKDDGTRDENIALNATVTNQIIVSDEAKRADFKIVKKQGDTDEPLSGAFFKVYNEDTHEEYTIKTDENGVYTSEASVNPHDSATGIWFKIGAQNTFADTPDNTKGALTTGKYTFTEVDANGNQKEEPITFIINEDNKVYDVYDEDKTGEDTYIYDMPKPSLGTLALVETADGQEKTLPAAPNQTITDICSYKYLKCDTDFTLYGKLMMINKETGAVEPFKVNGEEVTCIKHFTTTDTYEKSLYEACDDVEVKFENLDFTNIQGYTFVVYERLYLGNLTEDDIKDGNYDEYYPGNNDTVKFPIIHEDKDDANQTIKTPDGHTKATDEDGTKLVSALEEEVVIEDTVEYENLVVGKEYVMEGKLYVRPENDPDDKAYTDAELEAMVLKDENDKPITASETFKPTSPNGSVVVTFKFPATLLKDEQMTIVAFEDCYPSNRSVKMFTHADIHDKPQTIFKPRIGTTAKGTEGRNELAYNAGKFIDTIHYYNLEPNETYTVKGIAMDKKTGEALILNGKKLEAEDQFTTGAANKPNGAVDGDFDLVFEVTTDQYLDIQGKDMVIFEVLINSKGKAKAKHQDINDKGQELTVPEIHTTLTDDVTKTHVLYPDEMVSITDTVTYSNLIPGKEYTLDGKLMNKKTGEPMKDEKGKEITGTKTFKASETGAGTVEMTFKFNAKILHIEGESIVAFEWVKPTNGTIPVGVHADINDIPQTIDVPKVGTKVGKADWRTKDNISLTDTISFEKLQVGYTYVAKGWVVDKNGTPIKINGKEITAEKEFKPTAPNGTVDIVFPTFSAEGLSGDYVVFEEVYIKLEAGDKIIGEHKEVKDNNQTFHVTPDKKTGDNTPIAIVIAMMALAALGIAFVVMKKARKE